MALFTQSMRLAYSAVPPQVCELTAADTHYQAFEGNPLNKLHLKRKDARYLESLLADPHAHFAAMWQCRPMLVTRTLDRPMRGVVDAGITHRECIAWFTADQLLSVGINVANIDTPVLLGQLDPESPVGEAQIDDDNADNCSHQFADGRIAIDVPHWAISVTEAQQKDLIQLVQSQYDLTAQCHELRLALPYLNALEASILAQGRALLEWHASALHCGRCSSPSASIEGGSKRKCLNTSSIAKSMPRQCGRTLYARNDAVTITLAVAADGSRVLLGRKREFPAGVFTCLAGFLEGGESIEEGAQREIYEEAGVKVGAVRYFGTQPWPFLCGQAMLGCFAQVSEPQYETIELLDGELESARWFTRDEIGEMLERSNTVLDAWTRPERVTPGELRVPPPFAIAHQLIAHWYRHGISSRAATETNGSNQFVHAQHIAHL